jgi:hypothetical protein
MSNKGGRPKIEINWEEFEKLCGLHATLEEISGWFKCSEDTIERAVKRHYKMGFADTFKRHSSKGKVSLRRKLFEMAQGGNLGACIWLSKQHLGMAEKVEQKQEIQQTTTTYRVNWADELDGSTSTPSQTNPSSEKN